MADPLREELAPVKRQIGDFFQLDFENGEIHLHSVKGRAFILPTETWVTLRRQLVETFKEGAIPFMFQIGYAVGSSFMEEMKKLDPNPEVILTKLPEVAAASGWGRFTITGDMKLGRDVTFSVSRCPFCHRIESAEAPICDFLVGVLNGLSDNLFQRPHEAKETKCIPMKSEVCEVTITEVTEKTAEQRHWGSYVLFPWLFSPKR